MTDDEWMNIANDLYERTQFPNCMRPVDGKHIRIRMPFGRASLFYKYRHFFLNFTLGFSRRSLLFYRNSCCSNWEVWRPQYF